MGVPLPSDTEAAAWRARRCFGVEYNPLVGGPPVGCLSVDGFRTDAPGVDVCVDGLEGVRKPFTRFCIVAVPDGVCGVPATF